MELTGLDREAQIAAMQAADAERAAAAKEMRRINNVRGDVGLFIAQLLRARAKERAPESIFGVADEPAALGDLADKLATVVKHPSDRFTATYHVPPEGVEAIYWQVEALACQANPERTPAIQPPAPADQPPQQP